MASLKAEIRAQKGDKLSVVSRESSEAVTAWLSTYALRAMTHISADHKGLFVLGRPGTGEVMCRVEWQWNADSMQYDISVSNVAGADNG